MFYPLSFFGDKHELTYSLDFETWSLESSRPSILKLNIIVKYNFFCPHALPLAV